MPITLCGYSADGFVVDMPPARFPAGTPGVGCSGHLELSLPDSPLRFACRMRKIEASDERLHIGLERLGFTESPIDGKMLPVPEPLQVRAESPHPLLYGKRTGLRLIGIGQGLNLVFVCVDGSLLAGLGAEMPIFLFLSADGGGGFRGRVRRIDCVETSSRPAHRTGKSGVNLRVELEPVGMSASLAENLREYLVSGCGIPSETLASRGFPLRPRGRHAAMTFVDTMDKYEDVLELRRDAYVGAGKCPEGTPVEALSSEWDRRSRILCLYHGKTLAATATLTFPEARDARLRTESAFAGGVYPCPMPDRSEFIEVSGLCIHRDFRKGDLLQTVFRQVARLLFLSERRYIVTLADASLVKMYRRIGFRVLEAECAYLGVAHHLILGDKRSMVSARGMSRKAWHGIYGEMMEELERQVPLPLGGVDRARIKARLAWRRAAGWFLRKRREAGFGSALEAFAGGRMGAWL